MVRIFFAPVFLFCKRLINKCKDVGTVKPKIVFD